MCIYTKVSLPSRYCIFTENSFLQNGQCLILSKILKGTSTVIDIHFESFSSSQHFEFTKKYDGWTDRRPPSQRPNQEYWRPSEQINGHIVRFIHTYSCVLTSTSVHTGVVPLRGPLGVVRNYVQFN